MNARNLSIEMLNEQPFSLSDALQHLVQHHSVSPDGYIMLDRAGLEAKMPHRETALCIDFGFIPLGENFRYAYSVNHIPEHSSETEGHFPGRKLLPGHWAIEKMCLTAALLGDLIIHTAGKNNRKYLPVLEEIYRASFKQAIPPGSVVVMQAEYLPNGISIYGEHIQPADKRRAIFKIHAFVNGAPCIMAIIGAVLVPVRG